MTPLIQGQNAIVRRDARDEVVPEMRFVSESVEENEGDALGAPFEEMQFEAVGALDAMRNRFHRETVSRGGLTAPLASPHPNAARNEPVVRGGFYR
jgi:hypothetical protein